MEPRSPGMEDRFLPSSLKRGSKVAMRRNQELGEGLELPTGECPGSRLCGVFPLAPGTTTWLQLLIWQQSWFSPPAGSAKAVSLALNHVTTTSRHQRQAERRQGDQWDRAPRPGRNGMSPYTNTFLGGVLRAEAGRSKRSIGKDIRIPSEPESDRMLKKELGMERDNMEETWL